jgi:hypothetical protein
MATSKPHRYDSSRSATAKSMPTLAYVGVMLLVWLPLLMMLAQTLYP